MTEIELNNHSKYKTKLSGKAKRNGARGKVLFIGNHNSCEKAMPASNPRQIVIRRNLRRLMFSNYFVIILSLPRL